MNIAVPIAAYEPGTTGEYMARAFRALGHKADILGQWEFYREFQAKNYDLYFCVDSGGPLNLFEMSILTGPWERLAFWMIDYRRGKNLKNPNDFDTCNMVSSMGGWVFQSQFEDFLECMKEGIVRCSWLPLAADPEVWSGPPGLRPSDRPYEVAFVGNVWDGKRAEALENIKKSGLQLAWFGHGAAYMEAGAHLIRQSQVGFNISSFYGEPTAYDVNMRVFETLSCGVPLVTNYVPSLDRLFSELSQPFLKVYHHFENIVPVLVGAMQDGQFLDSGSAAREWILNYGTYKLRAEQALGAIRDQAGHAWRTL